MVEKNHEYEIEIVSFGNSGEGIGHVDGYTLFVTGALPGETVRVVVTKTKKHYGYARLLSVIKASTDRVEPVCPVAKRCGGCELQHMSYGAQLRFKAERVKECLERLGGVKGIRMQVIGCEDEPWHYRNKAQFPVGEDRSGQAVAGFYAARSHEIIACDTCAIQQPIINEIKTIVMNTVRDTSELKHLYIRYAASTGQTMVCFVVSKQTSALDEVVDKLREKTMVTSICLNIQPDDTNVILGEEFIPVYGPLYIEDKISDICYRIAPESFYQVNSFVTGKLYEKALEYAALSGGEIVWDLYCGIGTISLFLAKKAGKVIGVEIVPQAIKNAKENARINGVHNAEFICGAAENVIDEAMSGGGHFNGMKGEDIDLSLPDVIVVDPPRKGCDEKLIDSIGRINPKRIVYVSCDPATLARDVSRLREYGYELKKVCVVDQFWQTRHVETCCLLERVRNAKDHISFTLDMEDCYRIKDAEKKKDE